jgi:hypothetical protein
VPQILHTFVQVPRWVHADWKSQHVQHRLPVNLIASKLAMVN